MVLHGDARFQININREILPANFNFCMLTHSQRFKLAHSVHLPRHKLCIFEIEYVYLLHDDCMTFVGRF